MVPGMNADRYAPAVRAISERGHEIGNHGHRHENFGLLGRAEQRDALRPGNDAIVRVTGRRPVGFRALLGEITRETPAVLAEMGFQ